MILKSTYFIQSHALGAEGGGGVLTGSLWYIYIWDSSRETGVSRFYI